MRLKKLGNTGLLVSEICLGTMTFGSGEGTWRAIGKLDLIAYLSTSLNTGHAWGRARETIILPMLTRDEECQATTQESMFNFVRLSDGGQPRHQGPRSEVTTIADIGRRHLAKPYQQLDHVDLVAAVRAGLSDGVTEHLGG